MAMTRTEHLQWCQARALAYCDRDEWPQAYASMASDLGKHPETAGHPGIQLGMLSLMAGRLRTAAEMRQWIEGFR